MEAVVPCRLRLPLRLEQLDCVAQLGSPLVKFLRNRRFHFALHDFQLRERAFRFYFLKPFVEKRDLRAFHTSSGKFDCCKKSIIASRPRSISAMASANFP